MRPIFIILSIFAIAAALTFAPACRLIRPPARPIPAFRADELDSLQLHRVVLVPFTDDAGAGPERDGIQRAFMQEFEKQTAIEIVLVDSRDADLSKNENPRRTGKYRIETILDLAIRHGAEAILFGAITSYRPYPPQDLGLRFDLISANTGLALWSCNAQFDASDSESRDRLASRFISTAAASKDSLTWESAQASPSRFASLVSSEAVATFRGK
ncbi:MAG: hypothetical protein HY286_19295 [Planctomycetes bacterium]|nr:hypothetical protein [Planctomycetota bacterium]